MNLRYDMLNTSTVVSHTSRRDTHYVYYLPVSLKSSLRSRGLIYGIQSMLETMKRMYPVLVLLLFFSPSQLLAQLRGPQPGDIYREYTVTMHSGNDWRVTDPDAADFHEASLEFLPNPVLHFVIDDLEHAVRAEVLLDRWGGHTGTSGKRIRVNAHEWIPLPELTTTPDGHDPTCYMYQDNPIIEVSLDDLKEGENTLEGLAGEQTCHSFDWGQWGWYGVIFRIYYSEEKEHPTGEIVSPVPGENLDENPIISVSAENAKLGPGIARVEVLAYYEGYDENGDGIFQDWHHHYHYGSLGQHVGSAIGSSLQDVPYRVQWFTRWIPDQPSESMKLIARIQDHAGMWYVTDTVENLGLERDSVAVRTYFSRNVPEAFWVREGQRQVCSLFLPDDFNPDIVEEVAVHLRTWNGRNHGTGTLTRINEWTGSIRGTDHNYAYTIQRIPTDALQAGENIFEFYSETQHHGVELLWPGPGMTVRYRKTETEDRR